MILPPSHPHLIWHKDEWIFQYLSMESQSFLFMRSEMNKFNIIIQFMRSHVRWRGERNILDKGVETSP